MKTEEIMQEANTRYGVNHPFIDIAKESFVEGAKWANKTILDRACSVFSDILIEICPELLGYGAGAKAWENKFRKRLEGGAE